MIQLSINFDPQDQQDLQNSLALFQQQGWTAPENLSTLEQMLAALKQEHWPFADNSANKITLTYVLECLDDNELLHVLSEIDRISYDGAIVEVVSHHPLATPHQDLSCAHGLNFEKYKLLAQDYRQSNENSLTQQFKSQALAAHPLNIDWQLYNFSINLDQQVFVSKSQEELTNISRLNQMLVDRPKLMKNSQFIFVVHKVPGHHFAITKYPKVPSFAMRIYANTKATQFVSRDLKEMGYFEAEETSIVFSLIKSILKLKAKQNKPQTIKMLNAGANLGWYPLITNAFCPILTADAFEPTPETVEMLQHNVRLNGLEDKIKVFPIALSDTKGECQLFIDSRDAGCNALVEVKGLDHKMEKSVTVQTDTLDNLYFDQPVEMWPDLFLIDVEGHEQKVMDGATKLFNQGKNGQTWRPIIVSEFSPTLLCLRGKCSYYRDLVEKHNYRIFIVIREKLNTMMPIRLDDLERRYNELLTNNPHGLYLDIIMLPPQYQKSAH